MAFPNVHFLRDNDPYKQSSTRGPMALGTVGVTDDGRWFRWCKNGAASLAAGKLVQAEVPGANFDELAIDGAHSIGDKTVTISNGATAITLNMFRDGYMNIEDDTGEGVLYRVASHPAADTSATCVITLVNGISVALGSAATVGLSKHKCDSVIIHPSPNTAGLVGVPLLAVTASYYFWAQYKGPCSVLGSGTLVIGQGVVVGATVNGAVDPYAETDATGLVLGQVLEVAADTEYSLIDLNLPG